jgi:hypothetical protein
VPKVWMEGHVSIRRRYNTTENCESAFWRLILADDSRFRKIARAALEEILDFASTRLRMWANGADAYDIENSTLLWEKTQAIFPLVNVCLQDRVIFIMESGYVGLGRSIIQVHDQLHIVLGCDCPLVMREASASTNALLLVGDAYVLDGMYGNLINGDSSQTKDIVIRSSILLPN